MALINLEIDDDLKDRAYSELEKLGVTPSELARQTLQYVAERGQLPPGLVSAFEKENVLLEKARSRLSNPQRVKVSLDEL